jgi:hypothetical protein
MKEEVPDAMNNDTALNQRNSVDIDEYIFPFL